MRKNNSVPSQHDWAHSVTTFFLPITLMKSLFYPQREVPQLVQMRQPS